MTEQKCPKCGAGKGSHLVDGSEAYNCGSYRYLWEDEGYCFRQSDKCKELEAAYKRGQQSQLSEVLALLDENIQGPAYGGSPDLKAFRDELKEKEND